MSVMLHLCSNITPTLKAKIYHFNLKLASLHVSNQHGNYQFRKLSVQGSCFTYPSCLPLLGLSCSSRSFTRICFTFLISLPVMVQSASVLHAGEGRVKNCCQTGFSSPPRDTRGQMPIQTQTHPLCSWELWRCGLNFTSCLVHE